MACFEVITLPASDAFLVNRSGGDDILRGLGTAPGAISIHLGFAIEDDRTVYLSIGWETLQHNKAYARSPEYANLRPSLQPFLSGPLAIQRIYPSADLTNAFTAPLTEFASFTLKKGQSREELHTLLEKMCVIIDRASSPKHAPCALGESLEAPGTFHLIVGWDTVADHLEALNKKETAPLIAKLTELSELHVRHVPLKMIQRKGEDDLKSKL